MFTRAALVSVVTLIIVVALVIVVTLAALVALIDAIIIIIIVTFVSPRKRLFPNYIRDVKCPFVVERELNESRRVLPRDKVHRLAKAIS